MDRSQNYAFILHLFALHFICITFVFEYTQNCYNENMTANRLATDLD